MPITHAASIRPSEITPREVYLNRRQLMLSALAAGIAPALPRPAQAARLKTVPSEFSTEEEPTALDYITSYNNFYEFGVARRTRQETPAGSPPGRGRWRWAGSSRARSRSMS